MKSSSLWFRWALVIIAALLSLYVLKDLEIKSDVLDLLPDQGTQTEVELLSNLGFTYTVYIALESNDLESLYQSALKLSTYLEKHGPFKQVFWSFKPEELYSFLRSIWHSLPALLGPEDLEEIAKRITPEELTKRLQQNLLLLSSFQGMLLEDHLRRDPLNFLELFLRKLQGLGSDLSPKSYKGLFLSEDGKACLIVAETTYPLTDSYYALEVERFLKEALQASLEPGVSWKLAGPLVHTLANYRTIQKDLRWLFVLASLAIIGIFWVFFRSFKPMYLILIPFLSAPPAIFIVSKIFGEQIGGIALGFGIALLGLAVDFAIHIYINRGHAALGKPIVFAYGTTVSVFLVLLFSRVPAHRQMAFIALTGLTLAFLYAWFLISPRKKIPEALKISSRSGSLPPKILILLWILFLGIGLWGWKHVSYQGDLRNFNVFDQDKERNQFFARWGLKEKNILLVIEAQNLEKALELNDRLYESLKQAQISQIKSLSPILPGPTTQKANISRWQTFWKNQKKDFKKIFQKVAKELGFTSETFAPFFEFLTSQPKRVSVSTFLSSPMGPVLREFLRPGTHNSTYVLIMVPEREWLPNLEEKLRAIHLKLVVISDRKLSLAMEKYLKHDLLKLSFLAFAVVAVLALIFFRNPMEVLAALAPVFSALAGMGIYTYWFSEGLNFLHVLMGIMVVGLSIDYGLFAVSATKYGLSEEVKKAISLCALSTLSGFGVLILAAHPALKSLGETVVAGIGASWPAALLVTPILVGLARKR